MRIGITCHPSAGGSGILATELGLALAGRGHEVHFVTEEPPFRLRHFQANVTSHVVDMVSYPLFKIPPYSLALAARIADVAEEYNIQLWHAHYAMPNAVAAIFARMMMADSDPSFYRITRFAMEKSDAVTAVSNWLSQETMREFNLSQPVRTIYNFLDPQKFQSTHVKRCQFTECDEQRIIMHVSNFRPVKRVTDVVRVFKRVLDQIPARLVMVGEGPERMAAVGVAKQLGVQEHIRYVGNTENIHEVIQCADLILQPSEHESFGLVPLEAMACGIPVLATASGGITEVVENGVTGYLCDVGDIEAMAARATEILSDRALAKRMGEAGRIRALSAFDRDAIVDQYEALYAEVIAKTKASMA
jgi:glycosyltransferase involved in cell wall biosynthesis